MCCSHIHVPSVQEGVQEGGRSAEAQTDPRFP